MLVFLPGEALIKSCMAALLPLEKKLGLYVLPLYARLGKEEQQRIFDEPRAPSKGTRLPAGRKRLRKIILSTNIAETSLTIEGVGVVIDSGLAKLNYYNPSTRTAELRESMISRASAQQRKGRAGRLGPGVCYRLYGRANFDEFDAYTLEEIHRTDLTEVVLRMAELGIKSFEEFNFISAPSRSDIHSAVDALVDLGALESQSRSLSKLGRQMCVFPLLPKHSRILVEAIQLGPEVIHASVVVVAFLSCSSPFLLPHGEEMEAREAHLEFSGQFGDFELYLRLFKRYSEAKNPEQFCQRYYLDPRSMLELSRVVEQLEDIISQMHIPIEVKYPKLGSRREHQGYMLACLSGLKHGLALIEDEKRPSYQTRDGRPSRGKRRLSYANGNSSKIVIHPGSCLFKEGPQIILAGELMKTSQLYARSVSVVERQWLDAHDPEAFARLASSLRNQSSDSEWDVVRQRGGRDKGLDAKQKKSLYQLENGYFHSLGFKWALQVVQQRQGKKGQGKRKRSAKQREQNQGQTQQVIVCELAELMAYSKKFWLQEDELQEEAFGGLQLRLLMGNALLLEGCELERLLVLLSSDQGRQRFERPFDHLEAGTEDKLSILERNFDIYQKDSLADLIDKLGLILRPFELGRAEDTEGKPSAQVSGRNSGLLCLETDNYGGFWLSLSRDLEECVRLSLFHLCLLEEQMEEGLGIPKLEKSLYQRLHSLRGDFEVMAEELF